MKLSEKTTEEVKKLIIPYLEKLVKDYRDDMNETESEWFASRTAEFLHNHTWANESHLIATCCYLVENYTLFRKISVATFKTAFSQLYYKK